MANADYISIGASPTAAHWNALYQEAERRLGFHFGELSPVFWADGFDQDFRFLANRRYFVFGSTPVIDIYGGGATASLDNISQYILGTFYAGGYLPTSEADDNFRNYDMTPFDTAETACFLRNTPRPDDARPRTSSLGPSALVSRDTFNDAFTASIFPISGSDGRPEEYVRSFYYSPKAHRKFFTFGPEYTGSQYFCYLTVDGAVNDSDKPPVDEQPGTEHVSGYNMAEWFIFENGGAWTFPTYETKERFHRIHNIDSIPLVVTFPGGTWTIPPCGCLAVRRNRTAEFAKADRGGDGIHSGYFFYFQEADPRILHPTQINGPPLVAGSAVDQNGNNLIDPLMLASQMFYFDGGWWADPSMAVYDVGQAQDTSPIYNNSAYAKASRPAEISMPVGGWYAPLTDETKPIGDFVIHKGKLMFVSVNTQRNLHSQSFTVTPSDTFNLFRTEDNRVALEVQDIKIYSASVSIPQFGPSYNWTSSTIVGQGTGSIFFTSSVWTPGQTVLSTWTSRDPDNWHLENFTSLATFHDVLSRNSMSFVDASGTTLIPGTYFLSSPDRDVQIVQLSSNFCTYLFGALSVDPWGNPSGSIVNYFLTITQAPFVTAVTQSTQYIVWVISSDGPAFGFSNPVTTSVQLQNLWRAYSSSISPAYATASLFDAVSTILDPIRNYGGADNDCTINASLNMTPFGPSIVVNSTIPVDWPLINGRYQDVSFDNAPNFWLPRNYDSASGGSWYAQRGYPIGYYGGNLLDPGHGWPSPGNFRAGELCTPRIKRAYGIERSFTHDPTHSNFVISGSTAPYATTENARLKNYFETFSGSFLNFDDGTNDWRNIIAGGPTYNLDDIAFVGAFGTSANRYACLQAWKSKGTASYNGGYLDFGPGTGRETSYYPNEKAHLVGNTNSGDDDTIKPQVLHLTADHFNIAASATNHTKGTMMFGDYQGNGAFILERFFPYDNVTLQSAIGYGFTTQQREFSIGSIGNIRPRTCYAMWDKAKFPTFAAEILSKFGVTVKTAADFPDQAKFAAATAEHAITKWIYIDIAGDTALHTSDYPYGDISNGSASLWQHPDSGSIWTQLYPFQILPADVQWIDFTQARSVAEQMGVPFHYHDPSPAASFPDGTSQGQPVIPLVFDYIVNATPTVIDNDDTYFFGEGYTFPCSALGWYNDPDGEWVASGNPVDGIEAPPSGAFEGIWALRADNTPIKPLMIDFGPGVGGHQASLVQFDYGRLPEKWDYSLGSTMPFINWFAYPYCTVSRTQFNQIPDSWGNQAYLYRHYGPDTGTWRGAALIWPRNMADYERNHVTTFTKFWEWISFKDYPTFQYWGSIPRNVTNGISGPPRVINFTDDETVIFATDIGYAYLEIIRGFHDFSED